MSDKPQPATPPANPRPASPYRPIKVNPEPSPRSTVPSNTPPVFGRPMGASTAQRRRRRVARSGEPAGTVTALVRNDSEAELMLYGTIGVDWWSGEGITGQSVDDALRNLGDVQSIVMRVNSGGGDVFEATAIYNILVKHPATIRVEIEGVAASAATLISMAGDKIHIAENAYFMIHQARGMAWGTSRELRDYLKLLDNADAAIRLTYSRRTGLTDAKLVKLMDHDNWMTAKEAKELGFVDVVDKAKDVEPHAKPKQSSDTRLSLLSPDRISQVRENLAAMVGHVGQGSPAMRIAADASDPSLPPQEPSLEDSSMDPILLAACIAAGMDPNLDANAAMSWYQKNLVAVQPFLNRLVNAQSQDSAPAQAPATQTATAGATDGGNAGGGPLTLEAIGSFLDERERRSAEAAANWRNEVDATLALAFPHEPPATLQSECYGLRDQGITAVRAAILKYRTEAQQSTNVGISVNLTPNQPRDRHYAAIRDGLLVKAMRNFAAPQPRIEQIDGRWQRVEPTVEDVIGRHLPQGQRAQGWEDFARMSPMDIARECLLVDGYRHEQLRRLPKSQIAMVALGFGRNIGILAAEAGLHTSGSLAIITRDAMNKSLLVGYTEAPSTWRGPMRQAASVSDFKNIHRVKLSSASNVPMWPDNSVPDQVKLSNEEETYAVEAYAETISFSWRLLANDDIDAISRHPQLLGAAMKRTINTVAWQSILKNPVMADGQTLFLASATGKRHRSNLTTGAAVPTNESIGTMRSKMRQMRGLNKPDGSEGDDILNIEPVYIVGPSALEEVILKQVLSGADPAAGGNSAVYNTARSLTPVIEPLLDANSAKAWYLFASPNQVDTAEVTFLEGQEEPFTHDWVDDQTMAQNYTIVQTFAAKAIDNRGMQKHAGE